MSVEIRSGREVAAQARVASVGLRFDDGLVNERPTRKPRGGRGGKVWLAAAAVAVTATLGAGDLLAQTPLYWAGDHSTTWKGAQVSLFGVNVGQITNSNWSNNANLSGDAFLGQQIASLYSSLPTRNLTFPTSATTSPGNTGFPTSGNPNITSLAGLTVNAGVVSVVPDGSFSSQYPLSIGGAGPAVAVGATLDLSHPYVLSNADVSGTFIVGPTWNTSSTAANLTGVGTIRFTRPARIAGGINTSIRRTELTFNGPQWTRFNTQEPAVQIRFEPGAGTSSFSGGISGTVSVVKGGTGTTTLYSALSHSGTTTIGQGTLRLSGSPVPTGYAAHYSFDGGSGLPGFFPNEVTGNPGPSIQMVGSGIQLVPGVSVRGNAIRLSAADDHLRIGATGIPITSGQWTASAWVSGIQANTFNTLFRGSAGDHQLLTNNETLGLYTNGNNTFNSSGVFVGDERNTGWRQFTAVGRGTATDFYLDGVLLGSVPVTSTTDIYSVGNFFGGGQRFADLIDEVYVYQRALSGTEVYALYEGSMAGPTTTGALSPSSRVSISSGATLDVNGTGQTVAGLSGAGSLALAGATFTVNTGASTTDTFTGNITGPGSLVKSGPGVLTLAPTSMFGSWTSGSLVVNAGTLEVGSNSLLGFFANDAVQVVMNGGGIRASGATRNIAAPLTVNGSFTLGRLTNFTGTTTLGSNVTVTLDNSDGPANGVSTLSNIGQSGGARTLTVSAGPNGIGTGALVLAGSGSYTGGTVINTRVRASGSALGGGGVTVNSAGELQLSANTTIAHLSGSGTVTAQGTAGTTTVLTMGIDTATNGPDVFYGGVLADGSSRLGLTVNQAPSRRVLFLNASNRATYTGPTLIRSGAFIATQAPNVLSPDSDITVDAGGNLDLSGNSQVAGSLAGAGNVYSFVGASLTTVTLTVGGSNASSLFSGVIRSDAAQQLRPIVLVKNGTGAFTLTGTNTHTGGTTINAGTLQLGSNTATGSVPGTIVNNANLTIHRSDNVTLQPVTGSGTVTKLGNNTLTIDTTQAYTGTTFISAGTLQLGNGGTSGSVAGPIVISSFEAIRLNRSGPYTLPNNISGTGSITKTALSADVTFAGSNSFTGGINFRNGNLSFASAASIPPGGITISNGTVNVNGFSATVSDLNLGTAGSPGDRAVLDPVGSSTLTLTGAISFDKGSTFGTVPGIVQPRLVLPAGDHFVISSNFNSAITGGAYDIILSRGVTGSGNLRKAGISNLVLGPGTALSGNLFLDAGITYLGSPNAITGSINFTGGTLSLAPPVSQHGIVAGSFDQSVADLAGPGAVDLGSARLTIAGSAAAFTGNFSGAGSVEFLNADLTLNSANSNAGGFIVRNGLLVSSHPSALASAPLTLQFGTVNLFGTNGSVSDVTAAFLAPLPALTNPPAVRSVDPIEDRMFTLNVSGGFISTGLPSTGPALRFDANVSLTPGNHAFSSVNNASSSEPFDFSFDRVLTGPGGISVESPAIRVRLTSSAYAGDTLLNAGTLQLASASAYSPNSRLVMTGGLLNLDPSGPTPGSPTSTGFSATIPQLSGTGGTINLGNAVLTTGSSQSSAFAGNITGHFGAVVKQGTGTLTLAGSNTYRGNTTVNQGTLRLVGTHAPFTSSYQIGPGATLELARPASLTTPLETLSSVPLGLNGTASQTAVARVTTVTATAEAGRTAAPLVTVLTTLDIASDGTPFGSRNYHGLLDLGTNDAVFLSGTVAQYRDQARAFLASAAANGGVATQGLGSSSTIPHTRLAVFSNDASASGAFSNPTFVPYFSTFNGVSVNANNVLARFTYIGDTDLDGTLTGNDFVNLLEGFSNNYTGWQYGDFDYSGSVDAGDVAAFSAAFTVRATLPSLGSPADAAPGGGGVIPEPSALSLLAVPALALTRRRRA